VNSVAGRPRGRRLEWLGTAVVLALATWFWLRYFNRNTNLLDEGSTAAQAMRVLRGELIYRDFFTVVTPFSYYTVAWLFRAFGEQLMVLRWAALVTGIGIAFTSLIVARRIASWPFAAAAALLTTVWGWFLVAPNFYSWEAALFALVALACYVYGAPSWRWMIAAGIATGVTAMTKQNVGAYIATGLFVTIWGSRIFDEIADVRGRLKMSAQFIAGICVPVIPTLLWLIAAGAGPYLYESWIYYPLAKYPERFSRPFPDFFPLAENDVFDLWLKLVIYMPVVVYPLALIAIAVLAWRFQRRNDLAAKIEGHALLAVWCVGLLTLLQAFPRADVTHILFGMQPTYILFAYLCYSARRALIRPGPVPRSLGECGPRVAIGAMALIVTLLPTAILLRRAYQRIDWEFQNYIVAVRTERAKGIVTLGLQARRIDIVTKYITEHSTPDDWVFVVPWASGFNFLTNRLNPTRLDFMLFDDPEAYSCLLSRLDERPPKYVIYGYTWDVDGRHFRDYAAPVDRYIRSRYEIEFSTDGYEIWRRIEAPASAGTFSRACQPRRFRLSDLM
jgi:hypothetical protein